KINYSKREYFISGRVDRISISENNVFIFEYKTHCTVPQEIENIPLSHITQLATYQEILKPLYPNKDFKCSLIYVLEPRIFTIPPPELENTLLKI
ncbi:PD-(D/E)XK nuclease family protein, partial [Candidatus Liberibacter sp.]|uniref:PD-(D/E)XK nuclease family protein n=1 Tax=Candidatus Liberibacter sp. TaxID=34022 RepID=UPI0015F47C86